MDYLGFGFDPQSVVDLWAAAVAGGATVGILAVVLTLFYGRR